MSTIVDELRKTGFTEEQIAALDPRLVTHFTTVLSTAEQAKAQAEAERRAAQAAKEQAEILQRSNTDFYENKIVPALTGQEEKDREILTKIANAEALAAFYKTQNEAARTAGFVPAEAPAFVAPAAPPRNAQGQYVPNAPGSVPGSPTLTIDQVKTGLGNELGTLHDIEWKYRQLYDGKPMPIPPTQLFREAESRKLDIGTYAAQAFNFTGREQELAKQAAEAREAAIRAEEAKKIAAEKDAEITKIREEFAAKEKLRAEQASSNGDVRLPPGSAKIAEVKRAVEAGTRPDPLKMTDAERRKATTAAIHSEIAERQAVA